MRMGRQWAQGSRVLRRIHSKRNVSKKTDKERLQKRGDNEGFVNMVPKYLKKSIFSSCFWFIISFTGNGYLEILINFHVIKNVNILNKTPITNQSPSHCRRSSSKTMTKCQRKAKTRQLERRLLFSEQVILLAELPKYFGFTSPKI